MINKNLIGTSISQEVKLAERTTREGFNAGLRFSFCPRYSREQLRRINSLQIKRTKYGHRNTIAETIPVRKQLLTKNAFNQEAIL